MGWKKIATTDYVDSQLSGAEGDLNDDDLQLQGDTGTTTEVDPIDLDNDILKILGTANEIVTAFDNTSKTLTISLPDELETIQLKQSGVLRFNDYQTTNPSHQPKISSLNRIVNDDTGLSIQTYEQADGPNSVRNILQLRSTFPDSGHSMAVGYGHRIQFNHETAPGSFHDIGQLNFISTDLTSTSEDYKFTIDLIKDGTLTEALSLSSTSELMVDKFTSKEVNIDNQGIAMPSVLKIKQSGTEGTLDDCMVQFLHDGAIKFSTGFNHGTETYQIHASEMGYLPASDPHFELDASGNITIAGTLNSVDVSDLAQFDFSDAASLRTSLSLNNVTNDAQMPLTGGIFSGPVTLSGAPSNNEHAATKAYVDAHEVANVTGGSLVTITAATNPGSIKNVITGTSSFTVEKYGDPTNTTLLSISDVGNTDITGSVTCSTLKVTGDIINDSTSTACITFPGSNGNVVIEGNLRVLGPVNSNAGITLDAASGNAVKVTANETTFTPAADDDIVPKHHLDTQLATKQASLTFGIANTNSVVVDSASVADDEYARFTSSGLEGRTAGEVKTDLGLDEYAAGAITRTGDFTIDTSGDIIADIDGGQFTITQTTANTGDPDFQIISTHDGTQGPQMYIKHDSSSPADDDISGSINFHSKTDDDAYFATGRVLASAEDVTDATPTGKLELSTYTKASLGSYLQPGVQIIGSNSTEDRVDAIIGSGTTSLTTISGTLKIEGTNISSSGALKIAPGASGNVVIDGSHLEIEETQKLILDGIDANTYITESSSGTIDFVADTTNALRLSSTLSSVKSDDFRIQNGSGSTFAGIHNDSLQTRAQISASIKQQISTTEVTLTQAHLNSLHSAQRTLIAAQGANKVILPTCCYLFVDRSASTTQGSSSADLFISWNGSTANDATIYHHRRFMWNETGDRIYKIDRYAAGEAGISTTAGDNQPLTVKLDSAITTDSLDGMKLVIQYFVYDNS